MKNQINLTALAALTVLSAAGAQTMSMPGTMNGTTPSMMNGGTMTPSMMNGGTMTPSTMNGATMSMPGSTMSMPGNGAKMAVPMTNVAYVRVVHAVAGAPNVDVYVDGTRTVANAAFKDVTAFGNVPAGSHMVMITAAGDRNTVVYSGTVTLKAGTYYTVAAVGYPGNIKPKIFSQAVLNSNRGKALVNVYHLAPDAPRVQVLAADMGNAALFPGGVSYGNKVNALVNPMAVNVNVVAYGTTSPVIKNLSGISIAGGRSYSVFAVGTIAGKTLSFPVHEDVVVANAMMSK